MFSGSSCARWYSVSFALLLLYVLSLYRLATISRILSAVLSRSDRACLSLRLRVPPLCSLTRACTWRAETNHARSKSSESNIRSNIVAPVSCTRCRPTLTQQEWRWKLWRLMVKHISGKRCVYARVCSHEEPFWLPEDHQISPPPLPPPLPVRPTGKIFRRAASESASLGRTCFCRFMHMFLNAKMSGTLSAHSQAENLHASGVWWDIYVPLSQNDLNRPNCRSFMTSPL